MLNRQDDKSFVTFTFLLQTIPKMFQPHVRACPLLN